MTLDGKLATVTRESRWITSEAARQKSLELREQYDAILVGAGTIRDDNPQLTRRLGLASTPWTRIILDRRRIVPADAHRPHRRRRDDSHHRGRRPRRAPRRSLQTRHPLADRRRGIKRPLRIHPPRAVAEDDRLHRADIVGGADGAVDFQRRGRGEVGGRVPLSF